MLLVLLLVAFLAVSDGIASVNRVTISTSERFFVDVHNPILIRSSKRLTKVAVDMQAPGLNTEGRGLQVFDGLEPMEKSEDDGANMYLYKLRYHVPFELAPKSNFSLDITFSYCPSEPVCHEDRMVKKTVRKDLRFVSRYITFKLEKERRIHRPDVKVQISYIVFTVNNILHSREPRTWPKYRSTAQNRTHRVLEEIPTSVREKHIRTPKLGSIIMQATSPRNDSSEGPWLLLAKAMEGGGAPHFEVENYVLPPFLAQVALPRMIRLSDPEVTARFCASHRNYSTLNGRYDAQFCVCARHALNNDQCSGDNRACVRFHGLLESETACTNIKVNISELNQGKQPSSADRLAVFVEVREAATTSSLVVSAVADFERRHEPKLTLKMPETHKYGLPIRGQIVYKGKNRIAGEEELDLIVKEITDFDVSKNRIPTRLRRIIPVKANKEVYDFVLPPLEFENPALILVRRLIKTEASEGTPQLAGTFAGRRSIVNLWGGKRGLALQVTVLNTSQISCPGSLKLLVQTNRRLPENSTLILEFRAFGQISTRSIKLEADYKCESRDDDLGHYECESEDGEIRCLEGWSGANCLTPVCDCEGRGSICVSPGNCACKPGWEGNHCEVCVPQAGCGNGFCKEGGDCVCKMGYEGYLCNYFIPLDNEVPEMEEEKEEVGDKKITLKDSPRRTEFNHEATLQLDANMGRSLKAVAYIVVGVEMATDYIAIDDLPNCFHPILAEYGSTDFDEIFDKSEISPFVSTTKSAFRAAGIDFSDISSDQQTIDE